MLAGLALARTAPTAMILDVSRSSCRVAGRRGTGWEAAAAVLKILRIDHIGQAVPELEPQIGLLESLFGFRAGERYLQDPRDMHSVKLAVPGSSDIDWELLAPASPDSFLHRFLNFLFHRLKACQSIYGCFNNIDRIIGPMAFG